MAEMIATLSDACEMEFGFMATRLFRVFKTDEIQGDIIVFGFVSHVMSHTQTPSLLNDVYDNLLK